MVVDSTHPAHKNFSEKVNFFCVQNRRVVYSTYMSIKLVAMGVDSTLFETDAKQTKDGSRVWGKNFVVVDEATIRSMVSGQLNSEKFKRLGRLEYMAFNKPYKRLHFKRRAEKAFLTLAAHLGLRLLTANDL